jgi:hypothetical protein
MTSPSDPPKHNFAGPWACYSEEITELLGYFQYAHLPPGLQAVSAPFSQLAAEIAERAPLSHETAASLRKLLEAKDCAVRAALSAGH